MSAKELPTFRLFALWRLMAALLVMLYHFCEYGPPAFAAFATHLELLSHLLDLFFIVSGFLIWIHYADRLHSWGDFKNFIIRRFARLYPLHLFTLGCFCLVWFVVSVGGVKSQMTADYTFTELFKELALINAWGVSDVLTFNYVSWSLSAEWFCYLLLPLILLVSRKSGLFGLMVLLAFWVLAMETLTHLDVMPFPTWLEANTWGAYRVFADFTLGAVIADLASRRLLSVRSHWLAWGVFAFAIAVMLADLSWGYWSIFAIAFALYVAAQVEINDPSQTAYLKPLMPVSIVSFGIYLWHPVIGSALIGLLWKRLLLPMEAMSFTTIMVVSMVVTVGVALLSAYAFEAPMRKVILAWSKRTQGKTRVSKSQTVSVPAE